MRTYVGGTARPDGFPGQAGRASDPSPLLLLLLLPLLPFETTLDKRPLLGLLMAAQRFLLERDILLTSFTSCNVYVCVGVYIAKIYIYI